MHIQISHIHLNLGGTHIFRDFNLEVASGEKMLLRGPSGSGKSTLLRLILGFIQPDQGEIILGGEVLSTENVWRLRRKMGFVSQDLSLGSSSVMDLIQEILAYRGNRDVPYDERRIFALFERFRLPREKLTQKTDRLSGGERQRLALIISLLLDRELYLLDEVTSSIDEALRAEVIDYLTNLPSKTMMIVSHDHGWKNVREFVLD